MSFSDSSSWLRNFRAHNAPQDRVERLERFQGLGWMVKNGMASQAMETLVSGAFLVALALQLGASNLAIGILVAIPQIAALTQLLGVFMVERWRERKSIAILSGMISRPGLLLVVAAPFIPDQSWALGCLMTGLVIRYSFGCLLNSAWMSWIRDLVPEPMMGRYFAQRFSWITLTAAIVTLAAAFVVDAWKLFFPEKYIYGIMALIAFFFGTISVYCMRRAPEPRMTARSVDVLPFHQSILQPFKDRNFRRLMTFLFSWNFAANLALPFFNVHMLQTLKLSLTAVMAMAIINQMTQVLTMRIWGRISDQFSNKTVLGFCCPLLIACIFTWTLIDDIGHAGFQYLFLVLLHIGMGIATSGITLAANNINLKLAPTGEATAYVSSTLAFNALATGIAPIIGGLLADWFGERTLTISFNWTSPLREKEFTALIVTHWDFFFMIAAVLGFIALHQLKNVKERGQISERPVYTIIISEALRAFAPLASAEGLRGVMLFPLKGFKRKRKKHKRKER